jgi:hypothetical protein
MKGFKMKLLVAMIATLPIAAFAAGPHGHSVNQRQHSQQARIHQGVKSGQLTRHEARRLQGEQRHIRRQERAYRADGHLSRHERADLRRDLNRSSRHIAAQRHDGQSRGRYEGRGRYDGRGQHAPRGRYEGRGRYDGHEQHAGRGRYEGRGRYDGHGQHEPRGRYEGRGRWDGRDSADRGERRQDQRATRDPGVNQRQRNEQLRIAQGARSGELTRDEARGLRSEQRDIRRDEREYKSDGVFTRDERRDLRGDQNEASRNIYAEKHDDERR